MYSIKWKTHEGLGVEKGFSAWLLDENSNHMGIGWGPTRRAALDMLGSKVNKALEEEQSARIKQLRFIANVKV